MPDGQSLLIAHGSNVGIVEEAQHLDPHASQVKSNYQTHDLRRLRTAINLVDALSQRRELLAACRGGARQYRAVDRGAPGVRLVHNRSLALYAKLGFSVQESLPCMQGPAVSMPVPGYAIRSATPEDIAACDALCRRVHGHHRHGEVADTVNQNGALVVEHDGRIS